MLLISIVTAFSGRRHLSCPVDQVSAQVGYAPIRLDLIHIVCALLSCIALKDHISDIRNINVGISVPVKNPVAMTDNDRADRDMDVQHMILSRLLCDHLPVLIRSRKAAFRMVQIFLAARYVGGNSLSLLFA